MRRRQLVFLSILILTLLSMVAMNSLRDSLIDDVEKLRMGELELMSDRAATGIEAHLSRVGRAVEAVADFASEDNEGINLVMRSFNSMQEIFPEVGEMLWLQNRGKLYRVGAGPSLMPVGLAVEDLQRDGLEPFLGLSQEEYVKVGVIELPRQPSVGVSKLEFNQLLLFGHALRGPSGESGVMLVPYGLGSLVNEYLAVLSEGTEFEMALLEKNGEVVYSSWNNPPDFLELPFYPSVQSEEKLDWLLERVVAQGAGRVKKGLIEGDALYCDLTVPPTIPDEQPLVVGARLTPISIGGDRWTLVVTSEHGHLSPTARALFFSLMLGGASVVMGLAAASAFFILLYQRQARRYLQFQSAVELSRSAIMVLDDKGRCIFANRASFELTGGSPESVFDGSEGPSPQGKGGDKASKEWQGIRKFINKRTSEEVITSVMTSPIYEDGRYVGLIAIQRDITEEERVKEDLEEHSRKLKERTEELEQMNLQLEKDIAARRHAEEEKELMSRQLRRSRTMEVVGQLAGGVAHDFNNVLGAILACLYTLRKAADDKPQLQTEVGHIRDLCKRGGELTRQLLGLGRRSVAGVGPLNLVELMESLNVLLDRTLAGSIEVEVEFDRSLPTVLGNRANLLTTFLNLALNARDAMASEGGQLHIKASYDPEEEEGRAVSIAFADNGCGIPESLHEKIFEPFFTTKEAGVGTGLGLSTAYAAVTEAGGDLTVESAPDKGTVMTVYLKAMMAQPSLEEGAATAQKGKHPLTGGYILVVEDMEEIAVMISSALRSNGYRTIVARTGIDALAQLRDRRNETAAVLLDVILPELDGLDVHRYIKRLAPEIPVLFVTGREDLLTKVEGEVKSILKPFDEEDLLSALEDILDG